MIYLALIVYVVVLVGANMLVTVFGPQITPVLAFFLIGFDLSLRDWLHLKIRPVQMCELILFCGAVTYALNPAVGMIALASSVAFTSAALVDWATFARLRGSWLFRANGSNVAGAAVDSLIFPTLAFGVLMPHIVALQFVAKVAGGAVWAALLARTVQRKRKPSNSRIAGKAYPGRDIAGRQAQYGRLGSHIEAEWTTPEHWAHNNYERSHLPQLCIRASGWKARLLAALLLPKMPWPGSGFPGGE